MSKVAVIAGVGPGLGESLARRFAAEGCRVALFARSTEYIHTLADELGTDVLAVPTDITDPDQVTASFKLVRDTFDPVDILVNHADGAPWEGLVDISPDDFERAWRISAYGGLLCSQAVVPDMLAEGGGTILFTGATSATRGRNGAIGFSGAKFAVRGMAESMARELGSEGIHVAHVVIDGLIDTPEIREMYPDVADELFMDPDSIADSYWHLVTQDRSAWTLELDVRPHAEEF